MMLKYFKLSFSIRLLWQSRVTSKSPMFAICFTSYPTAVDALTQLYLRQVARKAPMQSEKQSNRQNKKNRSQNSGDFVFYIEFSMHDFSQLLRRKSIKTSLSNFSLAKKKRQFSTTSLFVSIFMRFLSTYLLIRHFCLFNMANCRVLFMFSSNTRSIKCLLEY